LGKPKIVTFVKGVQGLQGSKPDVRGVMESFRQAASGYAIHIHIACMDAPPPTIIHIILGARATIRSPKVILNQRWTNKAECTRTRFPVHVRAAGAAGR